MCVYTHRCTYAFFLNNITNKQIINENNKIIDSMLSDLLVNYYGTLSIITIELSIAKSVFFYHSKNGHLTKFFSTAVT